ncbi:DUF5131 family protein [Paractinoplanes atraurantiacus]|uniref:Protein gp37 n=1 Tax=Paractinoplanes atraurantiacus TaxID=1036182 RepID=A0A285KL26_9ACTN|nr:protein gp37 [Actinoplanes atraurantiacus]
MSAGTGIEWTEATWNPLLGCERVSAGCDSCYAIATATVRAGHPNPKVADAFAGLTERRDGRLDWTGRINLLPERLTEPWGWRKPRKVFVNSQADLFHDDVPAEFIAQVFATMAGTARHTYQLLTKRHARMRALLGSPQFAAQVNDVLDVWAYDLEPYGYPAWPLRNVWLGVSVEDQRWAELRVPALLDAPAAVRWLSCEPLLGPIDLTRLIARPGPQQPDLVFDVLGRRCGVPDVWQASMSSGIDWVVAGGESGAPGPADGSWLGAVAARPVRRRRRAVLLQAGRRPHRENRRPAARRPYPRRDARRGGDPVTAAAVTSAETSNIDAARAFFTSLREHLADGLVAQVRTARATLAGRHADTTTLAVFDRISTQLAAMAATCGAGVEHLDAYHGHLEQAVNTTGEAADTDFYRPAGPVAAGQQPGGAGRAANDEIPPPWPDEEIRPQWPGHKPSRRWEWKVSAHKPGDSKNVQYALPSADLDSEQALRDYVEDALQSYDWVELYHWYSGSELTFRRRPDGSVGVDRRQLNPTAGAPGHQPW